MNRLKEIRQSKKLTQRELGDLIGVTWNKIKDIENNRLKLTPEIAQKLEEVLSISGWWLLTGRGEKYINNNYLKIEDNKVININFRTIDRINEILLRIYDYKGFIKDKEFCDTYDIKKNTLSTWKKRGTIPYELIEEISLNENLSLDWLLFGKNDKKNSNETITINIKEYIDVKEIMEIIELLKYADKEVLDKIKTNLTKLKEVKEAF